MINFVLIFMSIVVASLSAYLAFNSINGWGWFLFLAFCLLGCIDSKWVKPEQKEQAKEKKDREI